MYLRVLIIIPIFDRSLAVDPVPFLLARWLAGPAACGGVGAVWLAGLVP
jgi:hypothetical protein